MNGKAKTVDMCNGPLTGKIIRFTIPVILSGVFQLLFNAVDMIVVGRFSGNTALAAVGSTSSITHLLVNLFLGFSIGAGITVSHEIGAKRMSRLNKIVPTSVLLAVISGAVVGVIGFVFAPVALRLMDSPADIIDKSTLYLRIIFVGMPMNMVYNFGASILRATGDTKKPLIYLFAGGIINVILNLIFVIVFDMDVAGVAIATIISQTISALLVVWDMVRGNGYFRLNLKELHIHKTYMYKIIRIGLPSGVQGSLFSLSNVLIQSSINSFGSVAVAGNSAAASIESFVYIVMNSFSQAAITFAGQNMGAEKYNRITRTMFICIGLVTACGLLLSRLVMHFAAPLLEIYCPTDISAINYGIDRMSIIVLYYFLCGIMDCMAGMLRGMGYSFTSMIISLFGACFLRVVWIYTIFARIHTLKCLYVSYPVSWLAVITVDVVVYVVIIRKLKREQAIKNAVC